MRYYVIYVSKSGNTKAIAFEIAKELGAKAMSLNLMEKKGRGTKEEREEEKSLFAEALEESKGADLVVVGSPTGFRKAHSKVIRFTKQVEAMMMGFFCTYTNKVGTTLTDLEDIIRDRKVDHAGSLKLGGLKQGEFAKLERDKKAPILDEANSFAKRLAAHATGHTTARVHMG
jgi:flavodoxin